jgi:hypothetical protein
VCIRVQFSIRPERTRVQQRVTGCVPRIELYPALIEVSLLRNQVVAGAFVLDDDGYDQVVTGRNLNWHGTHRSHQLAVTPLNRKDVDIEDGIPQERNRLLELRIVPVILREDRVRA